LFWQARRQELQAAAEPLMTASTDPATTMPAYYLAPFHAYPDGNLCWPPPWRRPASRRCGERPAIRVTG